MRGESASIGIDLGHKSLKAVKVYHKAKKFYFVDKVELAIEDGVLVDGEINQPEILGGKIIDALEYLKYDKSFDDIFLSISWSSGILADQVNLKFPKGSDEEEVILFEAGNRPPFDEKDITLDYQVLDSNDEKETKEVLLVAAKNSVLQKWARFLETFSIHPLAFDVDSFSIFNTFISCASESDLSGSVAILNIGQSEVQSPLYKKESITRVEPFKAMSFKI